MTETQWLAETTPEPLIAFLRTRDATPLTKRLALRYAIGCNRLVWDRLEPAGRAIVEGMGRLAKAGDDQFTDNTFLKFVFSALRDFGGSIGRIVLQSASGVWMAADVATNVTRLHGLVASIQADVLRDVVGNPFHPFTFDPSWRTDAVIALVESIRTHGRHDQFPILGDALIDAGCREQSVTNHCHRPGVHYSGCWVIEGILASVGA